MNRSGTQDERLLEILLRAHEPRNSDYKGPCEWNEHDKKACCEIVKDILGFANSGGGHLNIGVDETAEGFSFDTGLTEDQLKTWDTTRLNRFVNNYAAPPVNTRLYKVPYNDKWFVIIEVPGFVDKPHICQRNYPDVLLSARIYIRTDNNETAPISEPSDMDALIERAVRGRADQMLTAMRSILKGSSSETGPSDLERFQEQAAEAAKRATTLYPEALRDKGYTLFYQAVMFPSRFDAQRFDLQTLRQVLEGESRVNRPRLRWPFVWMDPAQPSHTYTIADGVETSIERLVFGDGWDFWQARTSGLFCQRVLGLEDSRAERYNSPGGRFASFSDISYYAGDAIDWLGRYCGALGMTDEDVTLHLTLFGTDQRRLIEPVSDDIQLTDLRVFEHRCQIPQVDWTRTLPIEEWRAARVDLATEAACHIMVLFNWPEPNANLVRKRIEGL